LRGRLNFAPRPFHQTTRSGALLWLLNLVLLAALVASFLYWQGLRRENASAHDQISRMKQRQQAIIDDHEKIVRELEEIDLRDYQKMIRQFGDVQASFSTNWGRLLDDLGSLLPNDVRIVSLKPGFGAGANQTNRHTVRLTGEARNKKAQLAFVSTLQEKPDFGEVQFESETYGADRLVFEISFTYLPAGG